MQFLTSSARLRVMPNTEDLCLTVYLVLKAVSVSPDTSGNIAAAALQAEHTWMLMLLIRAVGALGNM